MHLYIADFEFLWVISVLGKVVTQFIKTVFIFMNRDSPGIVVTRLRAGLMGFDSWQV
jgi:hypothetical protein